VHKHLVAKDGVGDPGCMNKVHFQQMGLQMSLLVLILLQRIAKMMLQVES
jgi:hypothetical protein